MNKLKKESLILIILILNTLSLFAQDNVPAYWNIISPNNVSGGEERYALPKKFSTFRLNIKEVTDLLLRSPLEFTQAGKNSAVILWVPIPDGSFRRFRMVETIMMEPGLAAKFPTFKTYSGQGIDHPEEVIKVSITDLGFHGMILSPSGNIFIDPYHQFNTADYIIYFRSEFKPYQDFICETRGIINARDEEPPTIDSTLANRSNGTQLRTYRLALACTGEYAAFFGGTVALASAAMVASMNRVNGIYENELSIRMVLVANNNLITYINSGTDPYTNNSGSTMLSENTTNLNAVILTGNYDIGHVFSTGGGGVAVLNGPCGTNKARGVTGNTSPVGDSFDVDYVAHEMGHQFGANHTFNSSLGSCAGGNRSAGAAVEPGSGITIMAYAGICGADDLAPHSIAYFSTHSFDEIYNFSVSGTGNGCAVKTSTGNNVPVSAGPGVAYIIPFLTPFTLTATGSDVDGDAITYSWEEVDLGPTSTWNNPTGDAAIFRPFPPVTSPSRTFPKLSDILSNTTTIGEILPSYARTLKFLITVRDNRAGGGGVTHNDDTVKVQVINTGTGFQVTSPNTAVTLTGTQIANVTWNVVGTNAAPINTANVKISLSTDGGNTFPTILTASTPNDGSENLTIPNISTTLARIKIEAVGNIYFDISNVNFTIQAAAGPLSTISTSALPGSSFCAGNSINVSFIATGIANPGNIFKAVLSNASGLFTAPDTIGSLTSTISGVISCIIPAGKITGSGYRIRVVSLDPAITGSDNGSAFTIYGTLGSTGSISGVNQVCQGQSGVNYSIASVVNAALYTWALPSGMTIASGTGTNSISVNVGAGALAGNITVTPSTPGCSTGNTSTLAISVTSVSIPGAVSGPSSICAGQQAVTFSVAAVVGATSYIWSLPSGASIISGATTNSISVNFSNNAVSGVVSVSANFATCGNVTTNTPLNLTVFALPSQPVINGSGNGVICTPGSESLSVTNVAGRFYQWKLGGVDIPGATNFSYNANSPGSYSISILQPTTSQIYTNASSVLIPDSNCVGAHRSIVVTNYGGTINAQKIWVKVNVTHTWDGDVVLFLEAPNGKIVALTNQIGSSGDNYTNTVFADSASVSIITGTAPYTGLFKPVGTITNISSSCLISNAANFNGIGNSVNPNGTWTLHAYDRAGADIGTLVNWSLGLPGASTACSIESAPYVITQIGSPVISTFTPGNGISGTSVTVNGSGFNSITNVSFNGVSASYTVVNTGQLTTTVPIGATNGLISVSNNCGTANSATSFIVTSDKILNLNIFIQGFYQSGGTMAEIVDPGKTDTITVELHAAVSPYGLVASAKGVINTMGVVSLVYPSLANGSYYIVLRHRNSIETWSNAPVVMNGITAFDFTSTPVPRPSLLRTEKKYLKE